MTEHATNVVLYARISEDSTGEAAGVERQERDARALAEARDWNVLGAFVDNDLSALSGGPRPGYRAMLDRVRAGGVDRIVVWHLSRLWRNREERGRDIGTLAAHRCGVMAVKGPDLDLSTAYGRGLAGLLGEFDTMESEVKGERVAAAAADRAQRGQPNGALGYGWRRDDSTGEWAVEPGEAAVVAELTNRLARGESLAHVTGWLNATGHPAPGHRHMRSRRGLANQDGTRWGKTSVRKIALRPSNAALRIHHRGREDEQTFPGAWPALVPVERWEAVTALLTAPGRGPGRKENPGARRHLISWGIGACGVCGGRLRVAIKGNHRAETYVCDEKTCVGRNKAAVDDFVRAAVVGRLAMPDALDLLVGDDADAKKAAHRARELRQRLDLAADQYADERITLEQMTRITARLRPEIEAEEERASRSRAPASIEVLHELAGERAAERWDALSIAQRRAVVEVLVESVTINRVERKGPGFDPSSVDLRWRTS